MNIIHHYIPGDFIGYPERFPKLASFSKVSIKQLFCDVSSVSWDALPNLSELNREKLLWRVI
ncbi:MAG TPA: hypothetical protein DDW65_07170 [Firmicutes bacterium]|nr:hypothetical protein [Bacillota bacterium]